jgi:uncharacterized protein YyaL (SSP411 family)
MARANRLAFETSPYLLQHAHNPVDWYPWGDEAFDRARTENKPVLLSIGYSSCHWCHVMERECFDDPEIAALMNELFVSIKVDREERPDVDDVYMKAVQLLIGRGGWPLTAFLTPDRRPFHGGTYFPPVDRHGIPGFPRVLRAIAQAYRERPDEVARATGELVAGVDKVDAAAPAASIDSSLPTRAAEALLRYVDWENGGLGGAPKFPHSQALQLMLRQAVKTGHPELSKAVQLTASRMAAGGMFDQVGGGFHRYAVDERWLVPHFEKMLYDNAQLSRLYLDAFLATGVDAFRRTAVSTLDYVLREMRDPQGGFYSATDADSEGEEGKYFVWTPAEVAALVGTKDSELVCRAWGITEDGNFEGQSIAHVATSVADVAKMFGRSTEDVERALDRARALLYAARQKRVPPLRDEKVIVAWNALVLSSMAEAGRALDVGRYVDAALAAAEFMWSALRPGGRLLHVWARGQAKQLAFLDDHAFLAAAFLDLYEATGDRRHVDRARDLVSTLEAHFHDERGGYFFTPDDGETLITRNKSGADGALPSGNAVAAIVHLRLHELTGDDAHRARAEELLRLYHTGAAEQPFAYATYLEALERYADTPVEVVVVGRPDDAGTRAMWNVVRGVFLPHHALVHALPDEPEPVALARDRPQRDGRATAYVCRNFTCSPPTTDPGELGRLLEAAIRP